MPCRNLVPKAVQRPHPRMWVACSRRETIHLAARNGLGALTFSFLDPDQAAKWVEEYYDIIKSAECVPISHRVNPNIAIVTACTQAIQPPVNPPRPPKAMNGNRAVPPDTG